VSAENRNRRIKQRARPSKISADATFITADDGTFRISEAESEKYEDIRRIVGRNHEFDAGHIDAAYKTGCEFFFTTDKSDILGKAKQLEGLLGIKFLHPREDLE